MFGGHPKGNSLLPCRDARWISSPQHPLPLEARRPQHSLPLEARRPQHPLPLEARRPQHPLPLEARRPQHPLPLEARRPQHTLPLEARRPPHTQWPEVCLPAGRRGILRDGQRRRGRRAEPAP
uniref:Uncharacterized protein n=1 Tax=Gadus morhua TaxID=8049 RepID=A0A8C5ATT3_GADMO